MQDIKVNGPQAGTQSPERAGQEEEGNQLARECRLSHLLGSVWPFAYHPLSEWSGQAPQSLLAVAAGARCEFLVPAPEESGFPVAAGGLGWMLVLADPVHSEQLVQPHRTAPLWGNAASPEFCKHQELPPCLHKDH